MVTEWLRAQPTAAWLVGAGVLAILIASVGLVALVVRRRRRRVEGRLRHLARDWLHDVYVPDGLGGLVHVDYLVLTDYGLLVIDLRRYPGVIFGAAGIDQWTQLVGGGSFKFDNPIAALEARLQSVRSLAPEAPIYGRVVFTEESDFPKGVPDSTSMIDELAHDIDELLEGASRAPGLTEVWARMRSLAVRSPAPAQPDAAPAQPDGPASQRHT